ncbi:chemotaxis protein CheA [Marinibaculum pumilum]|uniref:histidine kinase n=1 Tax=Marinibaculum pumilum TaxID=1766165 RepID=A0ABV7KUF7_9PROT
MTDDLVRQFVPEAYELLETATTALLELERKPADEGAVNRVFRAIHTLKGTAGIFDIPAFIRLAHAAEDLLGAVREREVQLDAEMVDALLAGADLLGGWIGHLEAHGALPADAAEAGLHYAGIYRGRLAPAGAAGAPTGGPSAPVDGAAQADPAALFSEEGRREAHAAWRDSDGAAAPVALTYRPEGDCFYKGEDPLHLIRQVPELHDLKILQAGGDTDLNGLDPFACSLHFEALTTAPMPELEHLFRFVREQVSFLPLAGDSLLGGRCPSPGPARNGVADPVANLSAEGRAIADVQLLAFDRDPGSPDWRTQLPAAVETLARVFEAHDIDLRDDLARACDQALDSGVPDPLHALLRSRTAAREQAATATDAANAAAPSPGPQPAEQAMAGERVLKVEQHRVDTLMDLVGELIVAKNALPYLAKRAESGIGARELAREIKAQFGALDRISQGMQNAIMAVRMMPVGTLFQRYPRLVRDTARKLGKQIDLRLDGEDTEADKNVIEALADPLLHIIRNALDHGVELPEARAAAGKPERATLTVKAFQEGDRVCIEVSDDGGGIAPDRVRAKAVQKGLVDETRAAAMSDEEVVQLVFLPGFSTRDEASDLSGRGVGMDVVRSTVERFGGDVGLHSLPGSGTTVRLRLPLSMAVTRVMMIEIDRGLFGIPVEYVSETLRLMPERVRRFKHAETFLLRDELVPLVRLREKLSMEPDGRARESEAVLVCRVNGAPVGLVVDDFNVGMDVVLKPLNGILAGMPGLSGTSVLGNGEILLILNLKELV